ncbi:GNAT family N-acetyltransferase [Arcanobacterium ihumii]|uniref:GNAT family N-acetyltransferase n=1 Tax=Arcanobacterium ihumii TaxID=2138162 RepID=UPI000F53DB9F|nr:GNAT family N-acetyltransferase [Arcanobacterium ihumii]
MLETERLVLREWEETDAQELFKHARDPLVGLPCGWPPHQSVDESVEVIRNVLKDPETYAVCLKGSNAPIGSMGLKLADVSDSAERSDECELGYWIGQAYWGKGYIPEACEELIRHGFEDLGMRQMRCCYFEGNEKSKRVQEKLGFRFVETKHDMDVPLLGEKRISHVSVLTKEEWAMLQ